MVFQFCLGSPSQLPLVQLLAVFMHEIRSSGARCRSDSHASSLERWLQPSVLPQDSLTEERIIWYQRSETVLVHSSFQTCQLCLFPEEQHKNFALFCWGERAAIFCRCLMGISQSKYLHPLGTVYVSTIHPFMVAIT